MRVSFRPHQRSPPRRDLEAQPAPAACRDIRARLASRRSAHRPRRPPPAPGGEDLALVQRPGLAVGADNALGLKLPQDRREAAREGERTLRIAFTANGWPLPGFFLSARAPFGFSTTFIRRLQW